MIISCHRPSKFPVSTLTSPHPPTCLHTGDNCAHCPEEGWVWHDLHLMFLHHSAVTSRGHTPSHPAHSLYANSPLTPLPPLHSPPPAQPLRVSAFLEALVLCSFKLRCVCPFSSHCLPLSFRLLPPFHLYLPLLFLLPFLILGAGWVNHTLQFMM